MKLPRIRATKSALETFGCVLKIGRAEEHTKTIQDEISSWRDSCPYHVTAQSNPERTRLSIVLGIDNAPAIQRWSLVAGDCIHNLRSALDNLIYIVSLHESNTDPPPAEKELGFPIANSPAEFSKKWCQRQIRTLSAPVRAKIEAMQPYNRPHKELPPLLMLLQELDNANKHRLLQVAVAQVARGEFKNFRCEGGKPLELIANMGELEHGAEIAAITFDAPAHDVHYNFSALVVICLHHKLVGPNRLQFTELSPLLRMLTEEVGVVIDAVLETTIPLAGNFH